MEQSNINSTVVCLEAIQESARMAQKGDYKDARIHLISTQRLLQRAMQNGKHQRDYLSYIVQAEKLDQFMRESQAQAQLLGFAQDGKDRDDASSKAMYQMKSVSTKKFNARM